MENNQFDCLNCCLCLGRIRWREKIWRAKKTSPDSFLTTAVVKVEWGLISASNFIENQLVGGGIHFETRSCDRANQTVRCSSYALLIAPTSFLESGLSFAKVVWFLLLQMFWRELSTKWACGCLPWKHAFLVEGKWHFINHL